MGPLFRDGFIEAEAKPGVERWQQKSMAEWHLEKDLGVLKDMLQILKAQASKQASEVLSEYSHKADLLLK